MKKLNILGVSAGNGVLLFPWKNHNIIANIEVRNDYTIRGKSLQWNLNFPEIPYYNKAIFPDLPTPDIIIGHPKCGYSSKLALSRGKQYRDEAYGDDPSFSLFLEAVKHYQPDIWGFENIPKLAETYPLSSFQEATGYPFIRIIDVSDWLLGGSQESRNRIFVLGSKEPIPVALLEVNQHQTADQLISGIPSWATGHFREPNDYSISIYGGQKLTIQEIHDYWLSYKPDRKFLVIDPVQRLRMNHAPGVYINWEGQFPKTVRKSNRQFNHLGYPMTPRELARLQSIPDSFELLDPKYFQLDWVTLLNKDRITVGSTPSYNVALWFHKFISLWYDLQ